MTEMPMRRMLLLLTLAVLAGCGPGGEGGDQAEGGPAATPVEVYVVEPETATLEVSATGTVAARSDVAISAETAGRVRELLVTVGDRVERGEALVTLDGELAELALDRAEAQLLMAEADLSRAESNLRRVSELWEEGDLSDADYEAAEAAEKAARGSYMAALAGRATAARQLRNTRIESPIAGLVAFVHVEEGQLIAAGTPVAHVVNDDTVEVDVGLNEDQMIDVSAGGRSAVRVRAYPGDEFEGGVEYVGPKADERTRTYPVRVVVPNRGGRLRSGMVAEVTLAAREFDAVLIIERDWVIERFGEPAVFVVADSLARLRRVSLGTIIGDRVVVDSGLEPGDRVVSFGQEQLSEGAPVVVRGDADRPPGIEAGGSVAADAQVETQRGR
ncbi:MAG: efflux RND transporter periplasmic adaptor subunit [Candidatus Eisenbacteria bacterium]|nr:efflux RND transporter periplasmic adaptor subunit [Candidatus Eisenbacteria bacterium]